MGNVNAALGGDFEIALNDVAQIRISIELSSFSPLKWL